MPEWLAWLQFRNEWISKQLVLMNGNLVCKACGKQHLRTKGDHNDTASADHIIPTSLGGPKYDESNLQLLCRKCNSDRGNMPYEEFIEKRKGLTKTLV